MREVLSGIFDWQWFSPPHGYNFNGHLILDAAGNICVDPVEMEPPVLQELARLGVARVVLTNRNHLRAANKVRERCGCPVAIHPADAEYARNQGGQIDRSLAGGEAVGPLRVVEVPGKSPGEIALHWPQRRLLVVGDAVIGNPPGKCGMLRAQVMDDPPRLRRSVAQLLELDFDTLLVGDGASILTDARSRLRDLVAGFAAD